ncbi:hypothetical protein AADW29_09255, partial [Campylobacter coli]
LNYPLSKHDLKDLKERCNEQSWEQGLHVPEKGKTFAGEVREETVAWSKDTYQLLNAQKMGEHEAEIEKIKNVFLAILRDIKKDIDNGEQPGEAVTAAMFQAMRDALAEQKQKPLSIDDVTAMIAGQIGQLAPMDEETADLFKQLAKKMMKGIE